LITSTLTAIESNIESLVAPWIAKKKNINLVIGIIQGEERWIKGWGTLHPSTANSPDSKTIFEIGSVTKVFTSTLLSLLAERQELELMTPINQLGTVYQNLPDNITLESLATHTSGLPRLPSNLMESVRQDRQNPYAAYTVEELHEYLQSHDGKPGKTAGKIDYSNLGVGLLGRILADRLGQSYEEAIVQHLCNPLGLSDTRITLSDEQQARFAVGYLEDGKPVKPWDLPTLAGAGALRSTADDLLTFLAANLQPDRTPIARAIRNTHQLRYETFAPSTGLLGLVERVASWIKQWRGTLLIRRETGVALGWFVEYLPAIDRAAYTHTGGTGGHRAFCGFIKESQTGVVVLSNYGEIVSSMFGRYSIDAIGLKILEMMDDRKLPRI
jgi:CubicO group peptidase (beta-lactamase class C family)